MAAFKYLYEYKYILIMDYKKSTTCERLTSLTGCSNCIYSIKDNIFLYTVRPEAIARVCLYIVQDEFIINKLINYDLTTISCSGTVILREKKTDDDEYKVFRQNVSVCGYITDMWCKRHPSYMDTLAGCTLRNVRSNIEYLSNIYSLRKYFTYLVKYLRNITICNSMCDVITINKEVSKCSFKLSNTRTLAKLDDPIIILEALSQATYAHIVSSVSRAYIDISYIHIRCNGTIELPSKYISTENPIRYLVENCIDILQSWFDRHRYHRMSNNILTIIDECKESRNIKNLHISLQKGIGFIEASMFFDD